jgi:hypothetical protein
VLVSGASMNRFFHAGPRARVRGWKRSVMRGLRVATRRYGGERSLTSERD